MNTDLLRRAASLMRERANAATPGAWIEDGGDIVGVDEFDPWVARLYRHQCEDTNAEHIASWHPAVALAVADWLDVIAKALGTPGHREWHSSEAAGIAVARAYLGETA